MQIREAKALGDWTFACGLGVALASYLVTPCLAESWNVDQEIAAIQAVGSEGTGNERAREAVRHLEEADASVLLKLLGAMDGSNGLALNWLRATAAVVVDREMAVGNELPIAALGEFLLDVRHHPRARRYAYELLARLAPEATEGLLPGMLNDPSVELRRDAVQQLIQQAVAMESDGKTAGAGLLFQQALRAARDVDQIDIVADSLRRSGRTVDLAEHFGFVMNWKVVGPFSSPVRRGFEMVFPPEEGVDLAATYPGKDGELVWRDMVTADAYGMLDINQAYGPLKEVTAYAYSEFESPEARPVEIRIGCKNAYKLWLNGEYLFGMNEYHRGMRIDQYSIKTSLRAGSNTLLMKVCQNEQMEEWTVEWQFQLRVCDATGTAILAANRPAAPKPEPAR